jgi:small-conductance mechanosensitive channel
MSINVQTWPEWLWHLAATVATVGVAYLLGRFLNSIVIARLGRLAGRSRGDWDDIVIDEIRRRVPWLALLGGGWLSLAYWTLGPYARSFVSDGIFALGGLLVTLALGAMGSRLVATYGPRHAPGVPVSGLTQNLVRLLILALGALVILNGLGVSITPMLTALGVGGLAVALALQEPLSNLFAGLFLSVAGQMRIGDFVKLDSGLEGYVVDVNWRATRIQMLSGNIIIVPNAKLSQAIVTIETNHRPSERDVPVAIDVGVASARDLERLESLTLDVARDVMRRVPGGVPEFEPALRFRTMARSRVDFRVTLRARAFGDQDVVRHEFVKRLHARYAQEGVTLSPAQAAP